MRKTGSRRNFLLTAPAAVAAGLFVPDAMIAQAAAAPVPFQYFPASDLEADAKALQAKPGNNNIFDTKALPLQIVMTTETAKTAKEFEWHEGRDHIFQILEGSALYEVGGTPKNGRNTKPGEWLAPESDGAKSLTLHKGDMLVIPRGTPHKRTTKGSVTFILISTSGDVKS